MNAEALAELERAAGLATPGPWECDTLCSCGVYGDGGPYGRTGYDAYIVCDASGRAIVDTLNRDSRLSEVHEEPSDDGGMHAWDEPARRDSEYIALCSPETIKWLIAMARRAEALETAIREVDTRCLKQGIGAVGASILERAEEITNTKETT